MGTSAHGPPLNVLVFRYDKDFKRGTREAIPNEQRKRYHLKPSCIRKRHSKFPLSWLGVPFRVLVDRLLEVEGSPDQHELSDKFIADCETLAEN